eukprot:1529356-Rhodomonas_salina.1
MHAEAEEVGPCVEGLNGKALAVEAGAAQRWSDLELGPRPHLFPRTNPLILSSQHKLNAALSRAQRKGVCVFDEGGVERAAVMMCRREGGLAPKLGAAPCSEIQR